MSLTLRRRVGPWSLLLWAGILALALRAPTRPAGAVESPEFAARFSGDSSLVRGALDRGEPDSARALLAESLVSARSSGRPALLARVLLLESTIDDRQSLGDQALARVLEAAKLAEGVRDSATWLRAMRAEANERLARNQPGLADRLALRMQVVAESSRNIAYEAWARALRGRVASQRGSYAEARRDFEWAAARLAQTPDSTALPSILNSLAAVHLAQGDLAGAKRLYERDDAISVRTGNTIGRATAMHNLAVIEERQGDPMRALRLFQQVSALELGRVDARDHLITLSNICFLELDLGHTESALRLARESARTAEQGGLADVLPWVRMQLGTAEMRCGHPERAKVLFRQVLAVGDTALPSHRSMAATGLVACLADQDSIAAALAVSGDACRALAAVNEEEQQARLWIEHVKLLIATGHDAEGRAVMLPVAWDLERTGQLELALAAWTQIARAERRLGESAHAESTIAHATALWERGRKRTLDLEYRELRGEQAQQLMQESVLQALAGPPTLAPEARVRAAFDRLERFKTRTLLERTVGPGMGSPGSPAWLESSWQGLEAFRRRALPADAVFLEFLADQDTTLLFAITRDSCRVVGVAGPARRLAPMLDVANSAFMAPPSSAADRDGAEAVAAALGERLFGQVAGLVSRASVVVIAPDGPLHRIAFAALVLPGSNQPLLARHRVVLVPSAALLAEVAARPPASGKGMLACAGGRALGAPALVGTELEVRELAARYVGVEMLFPDPAAGNTLRLPPLGGFRALHFGGHTRVDDQRPWLSGLVLGPTAAGEESLFTATEIASRPLAASLVVLASCASAGGRVRSGEGVSGIATAFLAAGVPTVVATLWPVDDRTTAQLMGVFYRELARGQTADQALRIAQEGVRMAPETGHPYYWAGFVLLGDGATRLPLRARALSPHNLALVLLVVSGFAASIVIARARR